MANWFKDEIADVGVRLEKAIEKTSEEINKHRDLTKTDLEDLIVFARREFGNALDERIEKAKLETSELITSKLTEFKTQLSEAADNQKRATIHNVTAGVCGAVLVSLISLVTKKTGADGLQAVDIYRTIMASVAGGYAAAVAFKFIKNYLASPSITRNSVIIGAAYIEVLKPKAAGPHLMIFATSLLGWIVLNETDLIISFLSNFRK